METDAKYRMAAQYWSRTSPPPRSSRSRSRSLFSMGNTRSSTATSSPGSLYREAIRKSNEFPTRKKSYYISAPDSIALQKNGVKFTFFWQNYPVEFCTKVVREVELMTIRAPETEDNNTMKVFKLIHHWVNLFRARRELKWAKEALNSRLAPLRVDATGVGPEFLIELFGCTCITEIVIPKVDNYMFKAIRRQSHIRHVETCFNDEFKWIPEVVSVRLKAADTKNFNYDLVGPYITRVTSKLTLDIKYNSLGTEVLNAFASLLEVMVDCMVINCDFDIICPSRSYDALKNMANTIAKLRDIVAKAYLMFPNINRRFMFTFPWRHVEDLDIKAHLLDLLKKQQINVIYRKNRRNEGIFTIPINDLTNCRFQFALQ
uniref:Uncharacterized protein n=1 Tax=Panagrellus redivivus TaxID=6233 RepID=A0A7E4ZU52_PANRE